MKVIMHLGLGDAIVTTPIIAWLAQTKGEIEIPCWIHNLTSVQSFFVNYPQVTIIPFGNETEMLIWGAHTGLRLGHYGESKQRPDEDFAQWFYRQAGLDIGLKHIYDPIPLAAKESVQFTTANGDYNFIHDDAKREFEINSKHINREYFIIRPMTAETIFSYSDIICKAKEIHCIDSSFLHLAESLPTTGKLFYHKYARQGSEDYKYLTKKWEVIE